MRVEVINYLGKQAVWFVWDGMKNTIEYFYDEALTEDENMVVHISREMYLEKLASAQDYTEIALFSNERYELDGLEMVEL